MDIFGGGVPFNPLKPTATSKNGLLVSYKVQHKFTMWLSNPAPKSLPVRKKSICPHEYSHRPCSWEPRSRKPEATEMSTSRNGYTNGGMSVRWDTTQRRKEWPTDTHSTTAKFQNCVSYQSSQTPKSTQTVWFHLCDIVDKGTLSYRDRNRIRAAWGWGRGDGEMITHGRERNLWGSWNRSSSRWGRWSRTV